MQKLNLIESDNILEFHGFPLEDGRFHLLTFGWYQDSHTYVAIKSSDTYGPILEAFDKLNEVSKNCGVHYGIFIGNEEIMPDDVDEDGVELPWDDTIEDFGGLDDDNPWTRGTYV